MDSPFEDDFEDDFDVVEVPEVDFLPLDVMPDLFSKKTGPARRA